MHGPLTISVYVRLKIIPHVQTNWDLESEVWTTLVNKKEEDVHVYKHKLHCSIFYSIFFFCVCSIWFEVVIYVYYMMLSETLEMKPTWIWPWNRMDTESCSYTWAGWEQTGRRPLLCIKPNSNLWKSFRNQAGRPVMLITSWFMSLCLVNYWY